MPQCIAQFCYDAGIAAVPKGHLHVGRCNTCVRRKVSQGQLKLPQRPSSFDRLRMLRMYEVGLRRLGSRPKEMARTEPRPPGPLQVGYLEGLGYLTPALSCEEREFDLTPALYEVTAC